MPNSILTVASIKSRAIASLGGSIVNVELTDADFQTAIHDAVAEYNRVAPRRRKAALSATISQKKYEISHTGLLGVLDVEFVRKAAGTATVVGDLLGNQDALEAAGEVLSAGGARTYAMPTDTPGEYVQQLSYIEDAQRAMSTDPDWHGQWEADGKYYLYVDIRREMWVSYTYQWAITPDDSSSTGLRWVDMEDCAMVESLARAHLRVTLGRALRKHGGVVTANGGTEQMDGDQLVSEGLEQINTLRERFDQRRASLPPVIG